MSLKSFLAGKWVGVLNPSDDEGDAMECTLFVTEHKSLDNSAHLLYRRRNLSSNQIESMGMDKMIHSDSKTFTVQYVNGFSFISWAPKFNRVLHKNYSNHEELPEQVDNRIQAVSYCWHCDLKSVFFQQKMHCKITTANKAIVFEGLMQKV